jgi:hypothetical protein
LEAAAVNHRQTSVRIVAAAVAAIGAAPLSGCSSCAGGPAGISKDDLQLAPKETAIVVRANVTRMRNTQLWRRALDLRDSDAQLKADFAEFTKSCAFDPTADLESVTFAFPQGSDESKDFALIARGTFNEQKLVACATERAKKDGDDITSADYNGKKLYTNARSQAQAAFLDAKTIVVASSPWMKRVMDLGAGKKDAGGSASENEALMAFVKRAHQNEALWGVGLVTDKTREQLKGDPNLAVAASLQGILGSVDFATGFVADFNFDLGSAEDATALSQRLLGQLADAKKSPQLAMAGLGSFLEKVTIEGKAATLHVAINFSQQQVDDLINRVKALLQGFRATMGGALQNAVAPSDPAAAPPPPPSSGSAQ